MRCAIRCSTTNPNARESWIHRIVLDAFGDFSPKPFVVDEIGVLHALRHLVLQPKGTVDPVAGVRRIADGSATIQPSAKVLAQTTLHLLQSFAPPFIVTSESAQHVLELATSRSSSSPACRHGEKSWHAAKLISGSAARPSGHAQSPSRAQRRMQEHRRRIGHSIFDGLRDVDGNNGSRASCFGTAGLQCSRASHTRRPQSAS
jgi:hypothetical protein